MTFTPNHRSPSREADMSVSDFSRSHARFHPCHRFFKHHLACQPAVHRLRRIETSGFEQLVRRRSAAAPSEKAAAALARFYAAPDLTADGAEQGRVLEVGQGMRGDFSECKAVETGMT